MTFTGPHHITINAPEFLGSTLTLEAPFEQILEIHPIQVPRQFRNALYRAVKSILTLHHHNDETHVRACVKDEHAIITISQNLAHAHVIAMQPDENLLTLILMLLHVKAKGRYLDETYDVKSIPIGTGIMQGAFIELPNHQDVLDARKILEEIKQEYLKAFKTQQLKLMNEQFSASGENSMTFPNGMTITRSKDF